MIRKLVDFALENRLLILALALILFVWGAVSFHLLPVEAYPDVADNYVEIITQWPGISAGDDPTGNRDERDPARKTLAILLLVRALRPQAHL
jgi:hypothetical protein